MYNLGSLKSNEERNNYYREYRSKNREKLRKYNLVYNKQWRKVNGTEKSIRTYKKRNPIKAKAHEKLNYAVRSGKMQRLMCRFCKSNITQGHHTDYSKPLEVIWLCALHHKHVHLGLIPSSSLKPVV